MQYGGWYNGRQWDGTRLGNPGEVIVGSNNNSAAKPSAYDAFYNTGMDQINKYIDELNQTAQGDYDYAAKWIEANYKKAVGSNDQETANFLKRVASTLEEQQGRIVYDYETGKYRAEQTADIGTQRTTQARDLALKRLAEDEKISTSNFDLTKKNEINATNTNLNQRGLISGPRENQGGIAGQVIADQNTDLSNRWQALQNQTQRNVQDTNISADQSLQNIGITKTNTLEDLATGARRGVIDEQQAKQQQTEEAQRRLAQARAQNEILKSQAKLSLTPTAFSRAQQSSTGNYYG